MSYKVVKLTKEQYDKYKADIQCLADGATKEIFFNIIAQVHEHSENDLYIYDKEHNKLVGFCAYDPACRGENNSIRFCYIKQLCILPEYRNKGLSLLLLKTVINISGLTSLDYIRVDFADKKYAKSICKKLSFKILGDLPFMKIGHTIKDNTICILRLDIEIYKKYKDYLVDKIL
jgi:hypothetical protein